MAQKSVTTPVKSPLSTPYQAPLPTALRGRDNPQVITVTTGVQRTLNGMHNEFVMAGQVSGYFPGPGSSDLLNSHGGLALNGYPTIMDFFTNWWKLYSQCDDTYTDSGDPTKNYTASYTLSGGGLCPQSSGYPGGDIFWPDPFDVNPYDNDLGSGWTIESGTRKLIRVTSSPIDVASYFARLKADMMGLALGNCGAYDDYHYPAENLDVTGISPSSYSGSLISAAPLSLAMFGATVTCGWQIEQPSNMFAGMAVQRQKATLTSGGYYFWVGLYEEGLPNTLGAVMTRVTFLSDGIIQGGESIGLAGDSPTHVIPFPNDPFPLQAMGANVVRKRFVFAVIGRSPAGYLPSLGLHMGDNY